MILIIYPTYTIKNVHTKNVGRIEFWVESNVIEVKNLKVL